MITTHLYFFFPQIGDGGVTPTVVQPFSGAGQGLGGQSGWDGYGEEELKAERRRLFRERAEAKERLELFETRQQQLKLEHDAQRKIKRQARAKREAEALAYRQAMAGVLQSIDRLQAEVDGYASQLIQLDMLLAAAESEIGLRLEFEQQNMNALALLLLS